jgi:hypothetical protein
VGRIAPLPDAQSAFMNADLKVYNTDIHIEDGGDVLRTGMTCTVEIVVERHDQALCVPVQCVVRLGGQPTVYLLEKGQPMPRPVQIGLDNNRMVHILSGLATGEAVMLTPPLADARAADGAPFGDMAIPPRPIAEKAKPANGSSEGVAPPPRLEGGREGRRRPPTGGQDAAPQGTPAADTPRAGATGATAPDGTGGTLPPSEAGGLAPGGGPPGGAMTPEARERMRERLEKMSPEEREAARRQWMERRRQQERPQDGGGAAAGGTGQP